MSDSSSVSPGRNPDREAARKCSSCGGDYYHYAGCAVGGHGEIISRPSSPEAPPTAPAWRCAECRGLFPEPTGPFERYTRRERVLCPACVITGLDSELDTIVEILGIEGSDKSISQSVREMASALDEARAVASPPEGLPDSSSFEKMLDRFGETTATLGHLYEKPFTQTTDEEVATAEGERDAARSALLSEWEWMQARTLTPEEAWLLLDALRTDYFALFHPLIEKLRRLSTESVSPNPNER